MPARDLTASRRTALGLAAAGLLATAGCDADTPEPRSEGGSSPSPTTEPQDADTRLVEQLRTEVLATLAVVRGARGRPPLAAAVRALEAMHLAHLAALDGDDPGGRPRRATGSVAAVRRRLATREQRHQQALTRAAGRAVSGDLAALLATMTAGTAQHRQLVA